MGAILQRACFCRTEDSSHYINYYVLCYIIINNVMSSSEHGGVECRWGLGITAMLLIANSRSIALIGTAPVPL